jgi:ankyrin repeat protein
LRHFFHRGSGVASKDCEVLLQAGANPKKLDRDGGGPLFDAVIQKDADVIKLLLDYGADPSREHDMGESLYDWAEFYYRWETYGGILPEAATEEEWDTPDNWLQFLDRLAVKHGQPRPDILILIRKAGAKTWYEMPSKPAQGEN